jgi:hypothetical protein
MRRTFALALAPVCLVVALSACGSDKKSPTTTVTASTVDGQQAPGAGGNNNKGNDNPIPSNAGADDAPTQTSPGGSTPDTQEKIDDGSPGQGGTP